jgi:hypothetical protein
MPLPSTFIQLDVMIMVIDRPKKFAIRQSLSYLTEPEGIEVNNPTISSLTSL